jgi:pyruvate dehydrogenase E1 component alpha subunit
MLLVLNSYRYMGHSKSDPQNYRSKEEIETWKKRDPIQLFRNRLVEEKVFSSAELDAFDEKAMRDVAHAVEFAEASPEPRIEEALRDVYVE